MLSLWPAAVTSDFFPPLSRVLQLMNLTDSRLAQAGNEKLELAMLSFFEQFRKIYIGDQVQKSSKVNSLCVFTPGAAITPLILKNESRWHYLFPFLDG